MSGLLGSGALACGGALGRGVLRLETGTRFWRDSSRGLLASTIEDLALDPRATGTLYAGVLATALFLLFSSPEDGVLPKAGIDKASGGVNRLVPEITIWATLVALGSLTVQAAT